MDMEYVFGVIKFIFDDMFLNGFLNGVFNSLWILFFLVGTSWFLYNAVKK
jgi:hypothetical protein